MLKHWFKNSYPIHYVIITTLAVIFCITTFLFGDVARHSDFYLYGLIHKSTLVLGIMGVALYLSSTIYSVHLAQNETLTTKTSSLSAMVFMLLSFYGIFTPEVMTSILVLWVMSDLMRNVYDHLTNDVHILSAGTFAALAFIVTPNAFFYVIVIWAALIILRIFKFRYLLISIIGFVVPVLIYFTTLYFTHGQTFAMANITPDISLTFNGLYTGIANHAERIYYVVFTAISIPAAITCLIQSHNLALSIRRKYSVVIFALMMGLILSFFSGDASSFLRLSIVPLTFVLSMLITHLSERMEKIVSLLLIIHPVILFFA